MSDKQQYVIGIAVSLMMVLLYLWLSPPRIPSDEWVNDASLGAGVGQNQPPGSEGAHPDRLTLKVELSDESGMSVEPAFSKDGGLSKASVLRVEAEGSVESTSSIQPEPPRERDGSEIAAKTPGTEAAEIKIAPINDVSAFSVSSELPALDSTTDWSPSKPQDPTAKSAAPRLDTPEP